MGLDWMLQRKIKDAHLDEGAALMDEYAIADATRREVLDDMLDAISLSPYEVIGSPMFGRDEIATAWLRNKFTETPQMFIEYSTDDSTGAPTRRQLTWDEVSSKYNGTYAYELATDTDGLGDTTGIAAPAVSFRGKLIGYCGSIIGDKLSGDAYQDKTSEQMLSYADALETAAEKSLEKVDVGRRELATRLLKDGRAAVEDIDDLYDTAEDLVRYLTVHNACKWLRYWGNKGFSMWAWY